MTDYMWIATTAWILLVLGYSVRKKPHVHVPLMLSGITLDFALVAFLEINRGAVEKALEWNMNDFQRIHIAVSSIAFVLYLPILYFGFRLLKNPTQSHIRARHKHIAIAALVFRTLGFLFMFSMWKA